MVPGGGTGGGTGGGMQPGDGGGMQPGDGGTGGGTGGGMQPGDGGGTGSGDGGGMQPGAGGSGGEDEYNANISDNVVVTQTQTAELTQECQTTATLEQTGTATGGDQYSDTGDNNQTVQANFGEVTVDATGAACQQTANQVQAGEDATGSVGSADPSLASTIINDPTAQSIVR